MLRQSSRRRAWRPPALILGRPPSVGMAGDRPSMSCLALLQNLQQWHNWSDWHDRHPYSPPPARQLPASCRGGDGEGKKFLTAEILVTKQNRAWVSRPYARVLLIARADLDWRMALNQTASEVGRKPLKERKRRPDDALPHSVNHWIRVEALAIFHEGEFSAGEVANLIGEDVKNVRGHIRDLYDSGCIELAGYKLVGNFRKPVYRAIVLPVVTDEVYRAMSIDGTSRRERRDRSGGSGRVPLFLPEREDGR